MRSSHIVAVNPATLADAQPHGWVELGQVDGMAYCHCAPSRLRRFLGASIQNGAFVFDRELTPDEHPEDGAVVAVVGDLPPAPWGDAFDLVFDPSPAPFAWADFAAEHPALAGQLRPHQWAGE